jgi:fucose 4-O-acetylase-like acetyltransferase
MYLALFKGPSVAVQFLHAFSAHDKHAVFAAMRFAGTLIYGGDYLNGTVGIFWFVTCLFLTQQIFNVCVSRLPGKWPVLSAFLLYVLTVAAKPLLGHTVFPWGINIVGCSLLFYAIGYYFGKVIFKEMNGWLIAGTLLLASGSIALVLSGFEIGFYMKHGEYGWFIFSPLAALALIKILGSIAEFAGRIPLAGSFLAFAGTGSLTIMFIHQYLHLTFFMKQCNEWPWVITGLIFVICCLVHFLLSRNALTRALFLGSWGDFALIRKKPAL